MPINVTIRKDDRTVERTVPLESWPTVSVRHVIGLGFRNMPAPETYDYADGVVSVAVDAATLFRAGLESAINDAHASLTKKDEPDAATRWEKSVALADKKLAAYAAGTIRSGGGGGPRLDDVSQRAIIIAWRYAKAALAKELGKAPKAKAIRARAKKMVAENGAYRHLAEKALADERAAGLDPADVELPEGFDESDDDDAADDSAE